MPTTRFPTVTAALFLSFLLLAGCATKQAEPPAAAAPSPDQGHNEDQASIHSSPSTAQPKTFSKDGSLGAGVGVVPPAQSGVEPRWTEVLATQCLEAVVPSNATALLGELAWTDYTQRLTLRMVSSDGKTEFLATNTPLPILVNTTLRLEVPSPAPGSWNVCAQANGADANVSYTLYGSVFATPIPEDFTAIPK